MVVDEACRQALPDSPTASAKDSVSIRTAHLSTSDPADPLSATNTRIISQLRLSGCCDAAMLTPVFHPTPPSTPPSLPPPQSSTATNLAHGPPTCGRLVQMYRKVRTCRPEPRPYTASRSNKHPAPPPGLSSRRHSAFFTLAAAVNLVPDFYLYPIPSRNNRGCPQ